VSWTDDDAFGSAWDLGGYVSGEVISWPIRRYLESELRREGIDPGNWRRQAATMSAGAIGTLVASIAGGPLGFLVGLLGTAAALGARYPGDHESATRDLEYTMALAAARVATEALEAHVSTDTWNEVCDAVKATVDRHASSNPSVERIISLTHDAIAGVNRNAADQWLQVYRAASRELDL
jgi:hypothetical protein